MVWFESLRRFKSMESEKLEYLQMIQEPICRVSTVSAIFKGFAATIVSGIAALTYYDVNVWILGLSFLPMFVFFVLDIYYLKIEKKFRFLYEQVRTGNHELDFSMQLTKDNIAAKSRVWDCIKSPSIWLFYPVMFVILIIVFIFKERGLV